jgi:hypothetical protein
MVKCKCVLKHIYFLCIRVWVKIAARDVSNFKNSASALYEFLLKYILKHLLLGEKIGGEK